MFAPLLYGPRMLHIPRDRCCRTSQLKPSFTESSVSFVPPYALRSVCFMPSSRPDSSGAIDGAGTVPTGILPVGEGSITGGPTSGSLTVGKSGPQIADIGSFEGSNPLVEIFCEGSVNC